MRSYMLVVRCFFGWLESEGWIRLDPSRKVKLPRAGRRHWDYLAPDEVEPVPGAKVEVTYFSIPDLVGERPWGGL